MLGDFFVLVLCALETVLLTNLASAEDIAGRYWDVEMPQNFRHLIMDVMLHNTVAFASRQTSLQLQSRTKTAVNK